jgi:Tol biopolymer transport system component
VPAVAAVIVAILAIAGWFWFGRSHPTPAENPLVAVPLTSYPGIEDSPSFSPDGTQVAFQGCPEGPGKNCDIYVKQIGLEPPSRLTDTPVPEFNPAWSPDGRFIAFARMPSWTSTNVSLVLIPQRGGRERVLAELDFSTMGNPLPGPYLAWTPNSKWLACPRMEAGKAMPALFLIAAETGEMQKLTDPPDDAADTAPAFSPDGQHLVFSRVTGTKSDLCLLRLGEGYSPQGKPEKVAAGHGAAWTPDASEIVFATDSGLWRIGVSESTRPQRLPFTPDNASAPAISRQGNRLAYAVGRYDCNIWRVDLREPGHKPGSPARFISSTQWEADPKFSPDGKRIAFASDRSGTLEIWACDSDGSNPVQVTSMGGPSNNGPSWSPDSQKIAFWDYQRNTIYVISANGGDPRILRTETSNAAWPTWSRDDQSIYFACASGIWKIPASGGKAVQIPGSTKGADQPNLSPDGKVIYYCKGWPFPQSLWRLPVEGGQETKILDGINPQSWTVGEEGIYFFTAPEIEGGVLLEFRHPISNQ